MIILQFQWRVSEENRASLLNGWAALQAHVEETEPGVLLYCLSLREQLVHVMEIYADASALLFHSQNSKALVAPLRELFEVKAASVSGDLSSTLLEALSERYPQLNAYQHSSGFTRFQQNRD